MAGHDHEEFREELYGHHPQSYDHREPNFLVLAVLGVTAVVGLGVIAIAIQFYYEGFFEHQTYQKVLSQENWALQDLRKKETQELQSYGYEDAAKATIRIPIDQAMQLVVKESAENRLRYPTNPYPVKSDEQLKANQPAVSQPGAAAAISGQQQGGTSNPNAQESIKNPESRKVQ
jgi:hypothetical protein